MYLVKKTRSLTEEERIAKQQEIDNIRKQNEFILQQSLLREREIMVQEQEEKQKQKFQKQSAELQKIADEVEKVKKIHTNLQNEIADLEYKKAEIIENADEIVKEKVDNALNNLDELQTYYAQSEDFTKHYRAYFEASAEIGKNENQNVKYGNNCK